MNDANGDSRTYILLARHRRAGSTGLDDLAGIADRFVETIDALTSVAGHDIRIGATVYGTSDIATKTAALLRRELDAKTIAVGGLVGVPELDGRHASPLSPNAEMERQKAERFILSQLAQAHEAGSNAVLVVGHQPALGIIGQSLTRGLVPLSHSSVACLSGRLTDEGFSGGRLQWVIAPSDPATLEHLRAKITSKMQVAALLAGLLGTALIFVLQALLASSGPLNVSLVLQYFAGLALFVAAALNLATVYAYDHLLMPTRFWAEPRGLIAPTQDRANLFGRTRHWLAWRPPSSDQLVIYQNMMRVWTRLFVPATVAMTAGVVAMGLALVRAPDAGSLIPWALAAALLAVLFLAYVRLMWPVLGVED
jgi:hypothetical protein